MINKSGQMLYSELRPLFSQFINRVFPIEYRGTYILPVSQSVRDRVVADISRFYPQAGSALEDVTGFSCRLSLVCDYSYSVLYEESFEVDLHYGYYFKALPLGIFSDDTFSGARRYFDFMKMIHTMIATENNLYDILESDFSTSILQKLCVREGHGVEFVRGRVGGFIDAVISDPKIILLLKEIVTCVIPVDTVMEWVSEYPQLFQ